MFLPLFSHRDTESLREGRLIYQQMRSHEVPREQPQTVLERLTDEHVNEEDLEKALAELPEESDVYRAVVAEGQKLDQKQRQVVGANLRRLSARIEQRAQTQADQVEVLARVERMRTALSAPPEARPVAPAPAPESVLSPETGEEVSAGPPPAEAERSLWTRGWEQAGRYWSEVPPTAKALGVSVAVASLAYGAYRLMRWLWGGTKTVAEKTVEKTKEGMGWFAKTAIAGSLLVVAGVAGYIGAKKVQEYFAGMAGDIRTAVKEQASAAKAQLQQAAAETREELAERGRAAAERVRDAARRGSEEIDERRRGQEQGQSAASPEASAGEAEPVSRPEAAAPGVAVFLLSKYLKSDKVADVYASLKGRTLGEILSAYDPVRQDADAAKLRAFSVVPAGAAGAEAQQYEQAAQKLVVFCGKRGPEARTLYEQSRGPTDVPFEQLTLEQYVLSLGGGLALAADAVEFSHDLSGWKPDLSLLKRLKEGSLSIGRKVRDLGDGRLARLSSPLQDLEVKEVMRYLLEEDGGVFAQRTVRHVLADAAHSRLTEEQIAQLPAAEQHRARIHALVLEICERALPTGRELLPFFHRTFPDRSWSGDRAANEAVVDQYVQEMSIAQALRFFSYWQMIRSRSGEEQVGGLVALQYEVLQLIDKRDAGYFGGLIKPKFKSAVVGLTEDLASPTFGQALAEVAQVDAAIVARVSDMLAEPAQRLAYYAGLAALGPVKYLAEWGLGTWEKHPVGAPLLAGTAAYGLVSPVRAVTNAPFKFGWWWYTRKDPAIAASVLKSPWQRFNPFRRIHGLMSEGGHYVARREAGSLLSKVNESIQALPDEAARAELRKALEECLRKGAKEADLRDFQRTVQRLRRSSPRPATYAELRQVSHDLVYNPGHARARQALQLYARPFREQAANLRLVREMRSAGLRGTALWGAGLAAQGYAAYEDWQEVGERAQEKKDTMTGGVHALAEIRQKLEQDGRYEMAPDGRSFVHKASGVVVDLKVAERQLTNVEGAFDSRINAQISRAATSTASFAGLALLGPRLAMGPAGLVVVGVELAIRGGIAAWEQSKMRTFIQDAPAWILGTLGLQATTGTAEEDWLHASSSWMISDILWMGQNDVNKERIRDRALFTVFCQDLRQSAPEVLGEIFDGVDTPDRLDAFFTSEFRSIVLPAFSVALFARGDGGTRWSNARAVDTESGWLVVPPRTTMVDIRRAMREAAAFALQHVREERYLKLLACRQRFIDQDLGEQWEQAMIQLGGLTAFGQVLRESALRGTEQKTRAQLLLDVLTHRLEQTPGDTRTDKLRSTPHLLTVTSADVVGLPASFSLLTPDQLFAAVDDPATRMRLRDVRAQTLGEEEAEKRERWNDWSLSRLAHQPSAVEQLEDAFYSAPFHTANLIAAKLGEPPVHQNTSLLDLVRRSRDAASYDAARSYITEGLDRMVLRQPAAAPRRAPSYDELYGANGPVVFARGNSHPPRELAQLIKYPKAEASGFETGRLQAVLFEGQDIGGNHSGVLATYIFGDLESGKVSVLQRGAGTFHLSHMPAPGPVEGLDRALTLQEFLARPGMGELLQAAKQALADRRAAVAVERERMVREAQEHTAAADRKWQEEASERARQVQERARLRTQLRERSVAVSGVLGYVPGVVTEVGPTADRRGGLREEPGQIEGQMADARVTFALPQESVLRDLPSFSAPESRPSFYIPTHFTFQAERDGKTKEYEVLLNWMRDPALKHFTPEDLHLIRAVLVTPVDLSAHPQGRVAAFAEGVRKYELRRLLKMAHYRSGAGWDAYRYEHELFRALWPHYRDAQNKSLFLNTLLNNLLAESVVTGGVFSSPYRRILHNMQHQW